jgi:outer membrane receptor protein involved in Fe transport
MVGLEGDYDLLGSNWKWDTYFAHSEQDIVSETPGDRINANYAAAVDAIVDPVTGQIVCRNLAANPGCVPYNPMGLGVNSQAAINYVVGKGHSDTLLKQDAFSIGTSGEPFEDWAGPVSVAVGGEWRKESVEGNASALDEANAFFAGNYHATKGEYNVKEVFLETVVPLLKDVPGAEKLDFNGAARYTDYSTSGNVTTWKAGATWEPIQDLRFRATRSRDIRAPNLGELFNAGQTGTGNTIDPQLNNAAYFTKSLTSGNRNLKPEEADTTGLGVVLSPRFLPGFTMSIDYYKIDITGAIATFSSQDILNQCAQGVQTFCNLITRLPSVGGQLGQVDIIAVQPTNVLGQVEEGVDLDASYNIPLPVGDLRLRGMMSYLTKLETADIAKGYTVNGRGINSADGGIGLGTGLSAPRGRYLASATYSLDPVTVGLTMRGITSGVYNNLFVVCQTGSCPAPNTLAPGHNTINDNHIDSIQYYDLSVNYKLGWGEVYGVLENALNEDPPTVAGGRGAGFYQGQSSSSLYDRIGRNYHVGFKFNF